MKKGTIFVLFAVILLLVDKRNVNASLKDKQAIADATKILQDEVITTKSSCGVQALKADVNWKSFEGSYTNAYDKSSAANFCRQVLQGMQMICDQGDEEKKAVQKIGAVICQYKKGISTENFPKEGVKLSGNKVTVQFDWNTANISDGVKSYLMQNLD